VNRIDNTKSINIKTQQRRTQVKRHTPTAKYLDIHNEIIQHIANSRGIKHDKSKYIEL